MTMLRVAAVQMEHGLEVGDNLRRARAHLEAARDAGVRLALLPEYFSSTPHVEEGPIAEAAYAKEVRDFLQRASQDLRMAVVANVVEELPEGAFNLGVAYEDGREVALQRKVHPMPREVESGIQAGSRLDLFELLGVPSGLLVCADILYPEASRILAVKGAQLLLNPVMSAYRDVDPTREAREMLYVGRAYDAGAFVLKAGGWRKAAEHSVAGRSLIAAPWGMLARYHDDFEDELLMADLDFDLLAQFRAGQGRFPQRRPEAYGDLL